MTTRQFTIVLLFSIVSCRQTLPERHYKSTDETTGGFNDFSLDLNSNKKLTLTIRTSIVVEENEAGTVWERPTKIVAGNWDRKNENIICSFNEPKSSIDSIFLNTDWRDIIDKSIVTFSQNADTAFIYGIPCTLVDKK